MNLLIRILEPRNATKKETMALIQCPDCGKEFSDSSKQCPNCGYRLKRQNTLSDNKTKQGLIIGLIGVSLLILSFIFYRLSYEQWYFRFVYNDFQFQLASMFAVICIILIGWASVKLKERFHNALTYGIILCFIFMVSIIIMISNCGGVMSSNQAWAEDEAKWEQNQTQLEAKKASNPNDIQYYYGTWEYKQPNNQDGVKSIKFIINDDETVQAIVNMNGKEITVYGSYYFWSRNNPPQLRMSFNDTEEKINGILYIDHLRIFKDYNDYFGIKYGYITNGSDGHLYLYENGSQANAKNPNKRVEITKIN